MDPYEDPSLSHTGVHHSNVGIKHRSGNSRSIEMTSNVPSVSDYSFLEKIGTGSYSTVYKALKKDCSREVVAIKCVESSTLSKSAVDNLVTEINLLKVLKHEHVVEMKDFFWSDGRIYIVMEYCDGGDLSSFIRKRHQLPENICRKFLQQLALALRYLRSHEVCHMDLKPQNLLLVKKPILTLKVGDFGFAQYLASYEQKFVIRGSPLYMAPEILLRHEYDARVDLWSVGVIMYECLFGKAPYSSSSFEELAEKIKNCRPIELPKGAHISPDCKDLLLSLLKHDPSQRISYEKFFNHDFLDLEHAPTKENYEKAVQLINSAVKMDAEKNISDAFHLYCEALRYFIPLLKNESDPHRKRLLRLRVTDYINRAEKLKQLYVLDEKSIATKEIKPQRSNENSKHAPTLHAAGERETAAAFGYHELCTLSKTTADMAVALEMGEVAEQYLAEGNYPLALEKFKSSLGMLVRVLKKEPPGRRRELLYQQVQTWMKEAESTKGLLATKGLEDSTSHPVSESQDQCVLQ